MKHVHIANGPRETARCGVDLASLDKPLWVSPQNAPGWLTDDEIQGVELCAGCRATIAGQAEGV